MRLLYVVLLVAAVSAQGYDDEDERTKRQSFLRSTGPPPQLLQRFSQAPQAFRAAPVAEEDEGLTRNVVTPTPQPPFRRPADSQRDFQQNIPTFRPQPPPPPPPGNLQRRPQGPPPGRGPLPPNAEEEEIEEEQPDRLSLLLPQSKFDCHSKKTGYYADDGLNCEVFHYCQDNSKHSWICPEGFLFHQVHLICMPPSSDNICKQSSQYHFVNDYLYRPINAEEAQTKPNVTLRYSDRYYPDNYYEEGEPHRPHPSPPQILATAAPRGRLPAPAQPQFRNQVFHSPEEVNIPLQQRRPSGPPPGPQRSFPGHRDDDEFEYDDPPYRQG